MNDDVTYGLWLLISLNSFVLITIVQSFVTCRPRAICRSPAPFVAFIPAFATVTGSVQSEN